MRFFFFCFKPSFFFFVSQRWVFPQLSIVFVFGEELRVTDACSVLGCVWFPSIPTALSVSKKKKSLPFDQQTTFDSFEQLL
jgi:hypothetical protein